MKNIIRFKPHVVAVAALVGFGAPHAMAQFGGLIGNLTKVVQPSSGASDPDSFLKTALVAEKLMDNSVTLLVRSLASKDKVAELDAARKTAGTITDAADKEAKNNEVRKNERALLNETLSNEKFKDDIKKMDARQKEELGNAAFNFALALLQDKALAEQSGMLISSVSTNPMYLTKLGTIKDVALSVSNQVSAAATVATKMPDIFSSVGVKAPLSKDEKPKVVAQVADE